MEREFSDANFEIRKPCRRFEWMLWSLPWWRLNHSVVTPARFSNLKVVSEDSLFRIHNTYYWMGIHLSNTAGYIGWVQRTSQILTDESNILSYLANLLEWRVRYKDRCSYMLASFPGLTPRFYLAAVEKNRDFSPQLWKSGRRPGNKTCYMQVFQPYSSGCYAMTMATIRKQPVAQVLSTCPTWGQLTYGKSVQSIINWREVWSVLERLTIFVTVDWRI